MLRSNFAAAKTVLCSIEAIDIFVLGRPAKAGSVPRAPNISFLRRSRRGVPRQSFPRFCLLSRKVKLPVLGHLFHAAA